MSVRSQFAAARVRSFTEAAGAYVSRIEDGSRPGNEARISRARVLKRNVLRQLATDERRHVIHRFAQFFSLARFAGVDAIELCFDPPVFPREARKALANAAPGWITQDEVLRDPRREGHQVYIGAVPELCCFGFIATEVLSTVMLRWLHVPAEGDRATYAQSLNTELTRAVSVAASEVSLSDHDSRVLFQLVEILESIAGDDFSLYELTDAHVLESWRQTASQNNGAVRFVELLRQLSALSAEVWASTAEAAAGDAASLDDSAAPAIAGGQAVTSDPDWVGHALSDPLIVELLSREEMKVTKQQLETLAQLSGLYLSRARVMTFGPVENKVIQAKRDGRDLRQVVLASGGLPGHAATLTMLNAMVDKLTTFILASVHLLWLKGHRSDAMRLAVEAGWVPREEAVALGRGLRVAPGTDARAGLEAALAVAEPAGSLGETIKTGRAAWQELRRRSAFASLGSEHASIESLEESAIHASHVRWALDRLHTRVDGAMGIARDGASLAAEYRVFCSALAHVHGFDFNTGTVQ